MSRPGPKPQDNRRILSGIMHVLKTGCRWQDCPPEYGPYTTVYNRIHRWSARGIWQQIFETVAGSPETPEKVANSRLKDFKRIATRYDKLARNFFSSACFVAAVVYWM
jgi:transposase